MKLIVHMHWLHKPVYYFFCFLMFGLQGCVGKHKTKDDGKIVITKPVKAPVAVSFRDAQNVLQTQIPSVKVSIIDDGGQVVTPNNLSFSSLQIQGGVMALALKNSAMFNKDTPYRFVIKAEAPGYGTNYRSVVIAEDEPQYINIFMVKNDDPPSGMAGFKGFIPIRNSTSQADINITPVNSNQLSRKAIVNIQAGTCFMYSKGKKCNVSDTRIAYNFTYGSPKSISALRTFPGGGGNLVTDAIGSQGEKIATPRSPIYFISSGWMTLEMKSGNQNITQFNKPIELILPIEDSLINPQTHRLFKEGEEIASWSLDERAVWKQEQQVKVERSVEGLVAKIKITHLSTWNLDSKEPMICDLTVTYRNSGGLFTAFTELIGTSSLLPFIAFDPHIHTMDYLSTGAGTATHTILRAPANKECVFVVYDNANEASVTGARVSSAPFNLCTPPPTIVIPPLTTFHKTLSFQIQDLTGGSSTNYNICKNAVWYRLCDGTAGLPISCISDECRTNTSPFLFGGMLKPDVVVTNPATVTLYSSQVFTGNCCIRLWYGKNIGLLTVQSTIDLSVPMNLSPGDSGTSSAKVSSGGIVKTVSFSYDVDVTTSVIKIKMDGGSMSDQLSTLADCN